MTTVLLYGVLVWLVVLTALLARMLRLLTGIQALAPRPPVKAGPVPAALERLGPDRTAVLFRVDQPASLKQANRIKAGDVDPDRVVFLVTGSGDDRLHRLLAPTGARVMVDPEAQEISQALAPADVPLAFHLAGGEIVAQWRLGRDGSFRQFSRQIESRMREEVN
jgi:hypothetical protein